MFDHHCIKHQKENGQHEEQINQRAQRHGQSLSLFQVDPEVGNLLDNLQ